MPYILPPPNTRLLERALVFPTPIPDTRLRIWFSPITRILAFFVGYPDIGCWHDFWGNNRVIRQENPQLTVVFSGRSPMMPNVPPYFEICKVSYVKQAVRWAQICIGFKIDCAPLQFWDFCAHVYWISTLRRRQETPDTRHPNTRLFCSGIGYIPDTHSLLLSRFHGIPNKYSFDLFVRVQNPGYSVFCKVCNVDVQLMLLMQKVQC